MKKPDIRYLLRSISSLYRVMMLAFVTYILASSLYVSHIGTVGPESMQMRHLLLSILIFILIIFIPLGYYIAQKQIKNIPGDILLEEKLILYRKAMFNRYGMMNSAGFIIALGFLATGEQYLIYMQVVAMLFMIIYKPSRFKIAADLELDDTDRDKLMNA